MTKKIVETTPTNSDKEHHIWCNYFMRPREGCKMCKGLFEKYPMKPNMIEDYFPNVIKVSHEENIE